MPASDPPAPAAGTGSPTAARSADAKRELRREMRAVRKRLADRPLRSAYVTEYLIGLEPVRRATRLLAYDSIEGEVETRLLLGWCRAHGVDTKMPEDPDLDPRWPDVIIVPGTAFTKHGHRIGQGGGWYDRFLPGRRDDVVTIGICFAAQLVRSIPTEPHDIVMDAVVTDEGAHWTDA